MKWHRVDRGSLAGACGAVVLLCSSASTAQDAPKRKMSAVCSEANQSLKAAGQQKREGHLREALESLDECARAGCASLSGVCTLKHAQIVAQMPSVVPMVTDDSGAAVLDVEVKADGQVLCSHLDGRAVPIEPGGHEFTFSAGGEVFATQEVLIGEGQRNRPLNIVKHAPGTRGSVSVASVAAVTSAGDERAPTNPPGGPSKTEPAAKMDKEGGDTAASEPVEVHGRRIGPSPFAWVSGGLALAGLATGGLLGYWALKDNSALESQCRPNCQPAAVTHVKTLYVASEVSLGVGAVAAGVAIFLFASPRYAEEKPKSQSALTFDLEPTRSGAFASVAGHF